VVYGTPGGSLTAEASFAGNQEAGRIGAAGEQRVGALLNQLARRYPVAVLHDLDIPGSPANIDHLVVHGQHALILDSKVWRPARYRSRGGRAYRGGPGFPLSLLVRGERCDFAVKHTMEMAADRLSRYLEGKHALFSLDTPLLVVCPSSAERARELNLRGLRVPGAEVLPEDKALARVEKTVRGSRGFSEELAGFLLELVRGRGDAAGGCHPPAVPNPALRGAPVSPADPDAGW
jgi:hypothetical protein